MSKIFYNINDNVFIRLTIPKQNVGLVPVINHPSYHVDYTYTFDMNRFSILDHFILSGALYNECISDG